MKELLLYREGALEVPLCIKLIHNKHQLNRDGNKSTNPTPPPQQTNKALFKT